MRVNKLAGVVAATAVAFGFGAATAAPAWATDNIKIFGEQMRISYTPGVPVIGYTVTNFGPSSDPVPHNGTLYEATLSVASFGNWVNPKIEGFLARAESGDSDPVLLNAPGSIGSGQIGPGGNSTGKLYFDVIGDVPNSVAWNDGTRDILAWVPGTIPLQGTPVPPVGPVGTSEIIDAPAESDDAGAMPAETGNLGQAAPQVIAPPAYDLTEAEIASPGFNR